MNRLYFCYTEVTTQYILFCLFYSKVGDLAECRTLAYFDALAEYVNYFAKNIQKRITGTKRVLITMKLQSYEQFFLSSFIKKIDLCLMCIQKLCTILGFLAGIKVAIEFSEFLFFGFSLLT